MSIGQYLVGLLLGVVCLGPLITGARRLRIRLLPSWSGSPAWTADAIFSCSLLVLALEIVGIAGEFNRAGAVIGCAAVGLLASLGAQRTTVPLGTSPPVPMSSRTTAPAAIAVGTIVAAPWIGWTIYAYRHGMETVDTLWYHLPVAARFVQAGTIVHVQQVDAGAVSAFYPAGSELFHAFGLLLLRIDALSPLINLGWAALAVLAAHAAGRPYGRGPHCAILVLLLLGTPQLIDTQPGSGYNDVTDVALMLSAAAMAVNGGTRPAPAMLAAAAAAAGLALGTKFTMIVPAVVLGAGLIAHGRRSRRVREAGIVIAIALALGGLWYVRNTFATGNPLPSLSIHLGPLSLPSPQTTTPTFTVAQYLTDGRVWRAIFLPGLRQALGPAWWAISLLAIAGTLATLLRPRDRVLQMLAAVSVVSAIAFLLTPQFLGVPGIPLFFVDNVRYAAVPLALGLALAAIHPWPRWRRREHLFLALAGALLVATEIDPGVWPTGLALKPFAQPIHGHAAVAGAALAAAGGGAVGARLGWFGQLRGSPRTLAAGGIAALVALGWAVISSYASNRYTHSPPLPQIYAWARHVDHARIGVVGLVEQYPLTGLHSSNYVQFIGDPEAHGGLRPITTCVDWRRAVNRGRYTWLVIAPPGFPLNPNPAPELGWTDSSPAVSTVLVEGAAGARGSAVLLRVRGSLDPRTCPR